MSKYGALTRYLAGLSHREIRLSFSDIEKVIAAKLPTSARNHRAWWSNNADSSVITKAWLDAGWRSEQVDMAKEELVFRRFQKHNDNNGQSSAGGEAIIQKPLFGSLKGTVRIIADITLPLDDIWSANEGRL